MRGHLTVSLGLILAAATGAQAAVSPTPMAKQTLRATGEQMIAMAEQLQSKGLTTQAEQIFNLLGGDPNPEVRNEARYRHALLLESRGEDRSAAVLLRRILDDKPDAAPVRLKLASVLQKLGDESAALRELRALRTTDLPLNVARFVDRVSASLQASKPLGFQLEVALAPDSNVNRATRSDTLGTVFGDFTFDEDSQARSGVGLALRGFAQARLPLTNNVGLSARASSEANLYRHKQFDDIIVDVAGGPEWKLGNTRLALEAGLSHQWYGMKSLQRSVRLAASATRPLDSVSQLRADLSARWADNRMNELQDGRGLSIRARYERALSPTLLVAASAGFDRFKARDDAYSTRAWNAGLSAYKDIGRMTVSAGFDISKLKADERLVLLPEAREDRLTRFTIGSTFRQFTFAGFAPVTRLVIERNKSSVEFYDFKRTRTEFGISRAF